MKVKTFKTHIENLISFIASQLSKLNKKESVNIEREIIQFVINQA